MEEVWNSFDYLQSKSTTSPENCINIDSTGVTKIKKKTDTKFYVPVAAWWTKGNKKPLEKLKSGFRITINWENIESNVSTQTQNQYSCNLIDPLFNESTVFLCYHLTVHTIFYSYGANKILQLQYWWSQFFIN